jgi:hypothetical protein
MKTGIRRYNGVCGLAPTDAIEQPPSPLEAGGDGVGVGEGEGDGVGVEDSSSNAPMSHLVP